jgi:hypothetical protein
MDKFYIIVIVVAIVCLILCLVAVGLSLQSASTNAPFPKLQAPCPDGWGMDGSSCTVNTLNIGTMTNTNGIYSGVNQSAVWSINNAQWQGNVTASICDKNKWAVGNGVSWDGVSNYNQCK